MLLTLAEYKALKGKNSTNSSEDVRIGANIVSVSAAVKQYLGRSLIEYYSTVKTEYFSGVDTVIFLNEYPVISAVVSYKTSTGYIPLVEDVDYFINYEDGTLEHMSFVSKAVGNKFIKVEYTGGTEKAPDDIKMAVADLVEKQIKQEHSVSKSMGGQDTMNYPAAPMGRFPTHIAVILDMYRVPMA